jgi:hypothetical protein
MRRASLRRGAGAATTTAGARPGTSAVILEQNDTDLKKNYKSFNYCGRARPGTSAAHTEAARHRYYISVYCKCMISVCVCICILYICMCVCVYLYITYM